MKPLITLLIIFAALTLMWSAAAVKINTPAAQPAPVIPITYEQADHIKLGMSLREVKQIMGSDGEVQSQSKSPAGVSHIDVMWRYKDVAIRCMFIEGKVARIVDARLKP